MTGDSIETNLERYVTASLAPGGVAIVVRVRMASMFCSKRSIFFEPLQASSSSNILAFDSLQGQLKLEYNKELALKIGSEVWTGFDSPEPETWERLPQAVPQQTNSNDFGYLHKGRCFQSRCGLHPAFKHLVGFPSDMPQAHPRSRTSSSFGCFFCQFSIASSTCGRVALMRASCHAP